MMKYTILLVVLALALFVSAQNQDVGFIDDFTTDTDILLVSLDENNPTDTSSTSTQANAGSNIAGTERDVSITARSGEINRLATTSVSGNEWQTALPNSVSCIAELQYDGIDNSPNLDTAGLQCLNLRANNADSFRLTFKSDLDTQYTITIYDSAGGQASAVVDVVGLVNTSDELQEGFIFFDEDFTGSVDFNCVGAIEVSLEADDNVDAVLGLFAISAPTNAPLPSVAPLPSQLPPPENDDFEWYTFDDDDNGRSPCGDEPSRRSYFLDDRGIVYYYFYGFVQDDDDDDDSAAVSVLVGSFSVVFAFIIALF